MSTDQSVEYDVPVHRADFDTCAVCTGMAHNATQDFLVCNRPLPCWLHPSDRSTAIGRTDSGGNE